MATSDLTTLERMKEYLQIASSNSTWNAVLSTLITQCSRLINKYCQRTFISTGTLTEYYDGNRQRELILRQLPIIAVTSVHDDHARSFPASTLVAATDYYVDLARGMIKFDVTLSKGRGNLKVVYTAGYTTIADLPENVVLAVNKLVAATFNKRKDDGQGGASLGNVSYQYEAIVTADVAACLESEMNLSESS